MQRFFHPRVTVLTAVALALAVGACSGENPTGIAAPASVSAALDGGVTLGSGSRATTENTTTAADTGSAAGRGVTLGSGS